MFDGTSRLLLLLEKKRNVHIRNRKANMKFLFEKNKHRGWWEGYWPLLLEERSRAVSRCKYTQRHKHTETLKDPKKQRHTKTIQADADKHIQVQILRCVAQGNAINRKVDTFYARNSERKLIVNDWWLIEDIFLYLGKNCPLFYPNHLLSLKFCLTQYIMLMSIRSPLSATGQPLLGVVGFMISRLLGFKHIFHPDLSVGQNFCLT